MSSVHLCDLAKSFGDQAVIAGLELAITAGNYVVLLGPSGCGKTTTLRMIAGLESPSRGKILMGGKDVTRVPPRKRDVSMVFQNDGLYPHLTVDQAIRLSLRGRCSKNDRDYWFTDTVRMTGVEALLDKLPRQLSGGELRRAALATAIAKRTSVRLLDEPLSGLDIAVRQQLQRDILQWHQNVRGTTIHVTHDGSEAMRMADQIAVMDGGRIIQIGTPAQIYDLPQTIAVAKSIGTPTINWLRAELVGGMIQATGNVDLNTGNAWRVEAADGPVTIGIRPEAFRSVRGASEDASGPRVVFRAVIESCRVVQEKHELVFKANDEHFSAVFDRSGENHGNCVTAAPGQDLSLWVPATSLHVFSSLTGQRLKLCEVG